MLTIGRVLRGTVLLSFQLWQTEFGGDPGIVGSSLTFDNAPYTVIGVMPREFHFPASKRLVWTPTRFGERDYTPQERTNNYLEAVGRLRRGVTLAHAQAEMGLIAAQSERQYPKENKDRAPWCTRSTRTSPSVHGCS